MVAFDLCLALGFPHPDYLLPLLTLTQFREWLAYHDRQPWNEDRADLRAMAMACMQVGVRGVSPLYPYFQDMETPEEAKQRMEQAEAWDRYCKEQFEIWKQEQPGIDFWEWLDGRGNDQRNRHPHSGGNGAAAGRPGQGQ